MNIDSFNVLGLSFKTTPIEFREHLDFSSTYREGELNDLKSKWSIEGLLILSTCNRVEIYFDAHVKSVSTSIILIKEYLAQKSHIPMDRIETFIYQKKSFAALAHLFSVVSSLDSLVVGEPQIVSQVKNAYMRAKNEGTLNSAIERIFQKAFFVGKKIRNETEIGRYAVSVSYVSVELVKTIYSSLDDCNILLIGAGEMAELCARHLIDQGAKSLYISNRSSSRAGKLASKYNAATIPYEERNRFLANMDIIIASTAADKFIVTSKDVADLKHARKASNKPMLFIDISVPRNVDPHVGELENVYLYNIDDLQEVVSKNQKIRQEEADRALRIVDEEVHKVRLFSKNIEALQSVALMRVWLERLSKNEINKVMRNCASVDDLKPNLEKGFNSLIKKILAGPIHFVKTDIEDSDPMPNSDVLRKIFSLADEE